jgi:hypothetical protein
MRAYDLHYRIQQLELPEHCPDTVAGRLEVAAAGLLDVGIVAFNGIPFIQNPDHEGLDYGYGSVTYFGAPVSPQMFEKQTLLGLGLGGVLTYMSQKQSLEELGKMSLEAGHDWAFHSTNVTLCFAGCPAFVEMSFARDGNFHLSWVEPTGRTNWNMPRVFTATASLKAWKKYVGNRDNPDFLATQRKWLLKAHNELARLNAEYFMVEVPS